MKSHEIFLQNTNGRWSWSLLETVNDGPCSRTIADGFSDHATAAEAAAEAEAEIKEPGRSLRLAQANTESSVWLSLSSRSQRIVKEIFGGSLEGKTLSDFVKIVDDERVMLRMERCGWKTVREIAKLIHSNYPEWGTSDLRLARVTA